MNDKTKLVGIDSTSIDVSKVNINLLQAMKVCDTSKLTTMKISTYKTEIVLRSLL